MWSSHYQFYTVGWIQTNWNIYRMGALTSIPNWNQLNWTKTHGIVIAIFSICSSKIRIQFLNSANICTWFTYIRSRYRWLQFNHKKLWDAEPICRGPGDLGGHLVRKVDENELCWDFRWKHFQFESKLINSFYSSFLSCNYLNEKY